jgi:hypothetical protein
LDQPVNSEGPTWHTASATGPVGALVSAWPALALAGSFELLMTLIRTSAHATGPATAPVPVRTAAPTAEDDAPAAPADAPAVARTVRAWHNAGRSQRAIARELNIDRRKVKRIIDYTT